MRRNVNVLSSPFWSAPIQNDNHPEWLLITNPEDGEGFFFQLHLGRNARPPRACVRQKIHLRLSEENIQTMSNLSLWLCRPLLAESLVCGGCLDSRQRPDSLRSPGQAGGAASQNFSGARGSVRTVTHCEVWCGKRGHTNNTCYQQNGH